MKPNHHPNSALLMAYASGSLTEAFSLVVASHLSFCQECQQKVNDAEMIGGALIDDLDPCNVNMSSLDQILSKLDDIAPLISFGASPRGSINLALASKCYAFIKHRGYVIPEDVREVVNDVLRHRIGLTYEAEAENVTAEDVISKIVNSVEVP